MRAFPTSPFRLYSGTSSPFLRPYQKEIAMKRITLLLGIVALLVTSCTAVANAQLSNARNRWQAANISHYRYNLRVACFCAFTDRMPTDHRSQRWQARLDAVQRWLSRTRRSAADIRLLPDHRRPLRLHCRKPGQGRRNQYQVRCHLRLPHRRPDRLHQERRGR